MLMLEAKEGMLVEHQDGMAVAKEG